MGAWLENEDEQLVTCFISALEEQNGRIEGLQGPQVLLQPRAFPRLKTFYAILQGLSLPRQINFTGG